MKWPTQKKNKAKNFLGLFELSAALTAQYGFLDISDIQSIYPFVPNQKKGLIRGIQLVINRYRSFNKHKTGLFFDEADFHTWMAVAIYAERSYKFLSRPKHTRHNESTVGWPTDSYNVHLE